MTDLKFLDRTPVTAPSIILLLLYSTYLISSLYYISYNAVFQTARKKILLQKIILRKRRISMSIPVVIEGDGQKERAYDLYSRLLKDRIIFVGKTFTTEMANSIVGQMLFLEADDPDKDIIMYINSPGGMVSACLAIYDTMNYIKPDVSTICVGEAFSAASFILAAGAKGKRYALKNSRVMMHQVSGGAEGNVQDMKIRLNEVDRLNDILMQEYSCILGKSLKQIKKDMDRDNFMSASEANDYGLVDHVLSKRE